MGLLTTFPLMALWLFYCGFSFLIPNGPPTDDAPDGQPTQAQLANVATAIFLFMATYSPGEGPVPFTYSAEAFPLYIRDVGMSFATATCWGFNVGNRAHSSYYAKKLPWYFNKHILRRDVEPAQPLFSWGDPEKPIKSTNETEAMATRQAGAMGKDEIWGRGAMTTGLG